MAVLKRKVGRGRKGELGGSGLNKGGQTEAACLVTRECKERSLQRRQRGTARKGQKDKFLNRKTSCGWPLRDSQRPRLLFSISAGSPSWVVPHNWTLTGPARSRRRKSNLRSCPPFWAPGEKAVQTKPSLTQREAGSLVYKTFGKPSQPGPREPCGRDSPSLSTAWPVACRQVHREKSGAGQGLLGPAE